jgi:hypothetical protein
MKISIWRWLLAFLFFGATPFAFAGRFKSKIVRSSALVITVPADHFLRVWNFTLQGGVDRGMVSVTLEGGQTPMFSPRPASITQRQKRRGV